MTVCNVISVFAVLCVLQNADAIVNTGVTMVLDYTDIPPGKQIQETWNVKAKAYATGAVGNGGYLGNIVIRDGMSGEPVATLADLAINATDTTTGVKQPLQLEPKVPYVITNENTARPDVIVFYIYITTDETPVAVFDAVFAPNIATSTPALIMSPVPHMTLQYFNTGDSAKLTLSTAPLDYTDSPLMEITQKSGRNSTTKIFGPIATLTPEVAGAKYSFLIDINSGYNDTFYSSAQLAFTSPGYSGRTLENYAHPLMGTDIDVTFSSITGNVNVRTILGFSDVNGASITNTFSDGQISQSFPISGSGIDGANGVAAKMTLHWDKTDTGYLRAYFETGEEDVVETSTTPSVTTTTTRQTTTSGCSLGQANWFFAIVALLAVLQ